MYMGLRGMYRERVREIRYFKYEVYIRKGNGNIQFILLVGAKICTHIVNVVLIYVTFSLVRMYMSDGYEFLHSFKGTLI